jgi:hypothetical protein
MTAVALKESDCASPALSNCLDLRPSFSAGAFAAPNWTASAVPTFHHPHHCKGSDAGRDGEVGRQHVYGGQHIVQCSAV